MSFLLLVPHPFILRIRTEVGAKGNGLIDAIRSDRIIFSRSNDITALAAGT
jgi:hypothetical protein